MTSYVFIQICFRASCLWPDHICVLHLTWPTSRTVSYLVQSHVSPQVYGQGSLSERVKVKEYQFQHGLLWSTHSDRFGQSKVKMWSELCELALLVCSGPYSKVPQTYEQQTFLSHSWETGRLKARCQTVFWAADCHLLAVSSPPSHCIFTQRKGRASSLGSLLSGH